eukprot:14870512-Ditylum_brightwellii.AAC.1
MPKRSSQLRTSTASAPAGPADPARCATTQAVSLLEKSNGSAAGTSSYGSNVMQFGSSRGGTLVMGCLPSSTSSTGAPVLVHKSAGKRTPPIPLSLAVRTASRSFPASTV